LALEPLDWALPAFFTIRYLLVFFIIVHLLVSDLLSPVADPVLCGPENL
jgi:hypothetical protein